MWALSDRVYPDIILDVKIALDITAADPTSLPGGGCLLKRPVVLKHPFVLSLSKGEYAKLNINLSNILSQINHKHDIRQGMQQNYQH